MVALLGVLTLSLLTPPSLQGQEVLSKEKEKIGEVLGRPVYRHQIRTGKDVTLRDELSRLFLSPVIEKYNKEHKAEITPTEDEIKAVASYFDQQHALRIKDEEAELRQQLKAAQDALKRDGLTKEEKDKLTIEQFSIESRLMPPGPMFAAFILQNWKLQKHLYDKYGGGRILWQQAGQEAFDATRMWLESLEQAGEFKITDPKLRATTYEYWTTMKHGSFLTADKARIQKEFLQPEWLPKAPAKK